MDRWAGLFLIAIVTYSTGCCRPTLQTIGTAKGTLLVDGQEVAAIGCQEVKPARGVVLLLKNGAKLRAVKDADGKRSAHFSAPGSSEEKSLGNCVDLELNIVRSKPAETITGRAKFDCRTPGRTVSGSASFYRCDIDRAEY